MINGRLYVGPGATLTIDPGVVIKFADKLSYLAVDGAIEANGIAGGEIYFTSIKDDSVGGDTNGDGGASLPAPTDWTEITLNPGSRAVLHHAVVSYGGNLWCGNFGCVGSRSGISMNTSTLDIADAVLAHNNWYGILMQDGTLSVARSEFSSHSIGVQVTRGSVEVVSTLFHDNNTGLITGDINHFMLTDNRFENNNTAVRMDRLIAFIHSGNTSTGGHPDGFVIRGGITADVTLAPDMMPFVVDSYAIISVPAGATLTLAPGMVLKFETNASLSVEGILDARGEAGKPIYFTSVKDDTAGGDTNNDGAATSAAARDWLQMVFKPGSRGTLAYATLRYAGNVWCGNFGCFGSESGILNQGGDLSITNSHIAYNNLNGIRQDTGSLVLIDSESDHETVGLMLASGTARVLQSDFHHISDGIRASAGALTLMDNTFDITSLVGLISASVDFTHSGNHATGTGRKGFAIYGTVSADRTWHADLPYLFIPSRALFIAPGATLAVDPGVLMKFDGSGYLDVRGAFVANGTTQQKVYLTSLKDDTAGGDTNGDGLASAPRAGDWIHLQFDPGSSGILNNVVLRYGGGRFDLLSLGSFAGLYNNGGTVSIADSEITHNGSFSSFIGIRQDSGTLAMTDSSIHHHGTYGILNNATTTIHAANNWWGSASGPYHPTLNPAGTGNRVSNFVEFIPWLAGDPGQTPIASGLVQFKSDAGTAIPEGGLTTEDIAVFKAVLIDPNGDQVQLEVELRRQEESFTGSDDGGILRSSLVDSGGTAIVTRAGLIDGVYKWRARAKDSYGNISAWQEFGIIPGIDFEVKLVPLYTQIESDFPTRDETKSWSTTDDLYGSGDYQTCVDSENGRSTIRRCGCAITSAVMLMRYYKITEGADFQDANPKNINAWLDAHHGYTAGGNLLWPQIPVYAQGKISFDGVVNVFNPAKLDQYVGAGKPVILYQNVIGHFLLADGKLNATYTVRDPRWYNTRYLTQASGSDPFVRDYGNTFSGLRLFSPVTGQGIIPDDIYISIASPAELLITDPSGRKIGNDPITGISYQDIPGAVYYKEGISAAIDDPLPPHESKIVWIPDPVAGAYGIQVIGTDTGSYTLDFAAYDAEGALHQGALTGSTTKDRVTEYTAYTAAFTPDQRQGIVIKPQDQEPPEAKIYFDTRERKLKIEGVDNFSSTTVQQQGNTFVISDAAQNMLSLVFGEIKPQEKEIEATLASLQYNDQTKIVLPKTVLKFGWSVDKSTNRIRVLEQWIKVENKFEIAAKYDFKKNQTEIDKIEQGRTIKQVLSGLVVVKLATKSGDLGYEF